MDENEITQRLRDAGEHQVPSDVRASHLTRMDAARPAARRPSRFGRMAVAAAAFAGFAVGSTGFAMAGALPAPAQRVAHDVLATVNVNVEHPENRGKCVSEAARADPAAKREAKEACPKGGKGKGRPDHAGEGGPPEALMDDGDPCKGPPPWAGRGRPTAQEKADHKSARAGCPPEAGEAPEVEDLEDGPVPPADGPPGNQDGGAVPPVETPAPPAPDAGPGEG